MSSHRRHEKSKLDVLHTQLDEKEDRLLGILQPEMKIIQERVSVTEAQDLENQRIASSVLKSFSLDIAFLTREMTFL